MLDMFTLGIIICPNDTVGLELDFYEGFIPSNADMISCSRGRFWLYDFRDAASARSWNCLRNNLNFFLYSSLSLSK